MSVFEGAVALVTGGGQGLGEAICNKLAVDGAVVAVTDVNLPAAQGVARRLEAEGHTARAYECNVTSWDGVHAVVDSIEQELGPIAILVCNAGVSQSIDFLKMNEHEWDRVIEINLKGLFVTMRSVVPRMVERRKGRVVHIGSISSKVGYARFAHYTASKFGGLGLSPMPLN